MEGPVCEEPHPLDLNCTEDCEESTSNYGWDIRFLRASYDPKNQLTTFCYEINQRLGRGKTGKGGRGMSKNDWFGGWRRRRRRLLGEAEIDQCLLKHVPKVIPVYKWLDGEIDS